MSTGADRSTVAGQAPSLMDRFLAPIPAERLATLRVLIFGYATVFTAIRCIYWLDVSRLPDHRYDPVGLLGFVDAPFSPGVVMAGTAATFFFGVLATLGWRWRLTAPAFGFLLLVLTTHGQSWGHVSHAENLMVLHVLILMFAPAAATWSIDASRRSGASLPGAVDGWTVRVMMVVTVLGYVLAGWAKWRNGGLEWVSGDVLRNQVARDNLRKLLLGDPYSPIGAFLVKHGWLFRPMAKASMLIELGAPVALVAARTRYWWVGAAWMFHVGILVIMAIFFPYQVLGLAFTPFLPVERLGWWVVHRRGGGHVEGVGVDAGLVPG